MNLAESEVMELYQSLILDHNKNPRNFRKLEPASVVQEGFNPVCGDHYFLYLNLEAANVQGEQKERQTTIIKNVAFQGEGCAISKASASLMTTILEGKTLEQAQHVFEEFHLLLTRKLNPALDPHSLGKLQAFSSVWKYPARVKCAGLIWHTLKAALEGDRGIVKTE